MVASEYRWNRDGGEVDEEWDRYLERSRYGHHEQTSRWGRVKRVYGWEPERLKCYLGSANDGELLGGVQILWRKTRLGKVAYICKGPAYDLANGKLGTAFLRRIDEWARARGVLYLVAELPYEAGDVAAEWLEFGFAPHPARLPPSGLMTATLLVDLSVGPEAILAQMSRTKRRSIRKSLGSGLEFRAGRFEELKVFREMMEALCQRRKTSVTPPQRDFFEHLWRAFEGTGWMRFFVTTYNGELVNGMVNFAFGEAFRCWKIGWAGAQEEKNPDEFIFWKCMEWAREAGHRWFDFVSIDRSAAERVIRGERPSAEWMPDGVTFAKLAYGGEARLLPLPLSRFYNPIARMFFRFGGLRLLESEGLAKVAARIHARSAHGA